MSGYFLFFPLPMQCKKRRQVNSVGVYSQSALFNLRVVFYSQVFPISHANFLSLFSNRRGTIRVRPWRLQSYNLILNMLWLWFFLTISFFVGLCTFVREQHSHQDFVKPRYILTRHPELTFCLEGRLLLLLAVICEFCFPW